MMYKKIDTTEIEYGKYANPNDIKQIIENIEAIKGGEAFEEPISTIFDLNEKVDDEVSRIDKNINELKTLIGTGGGSGEIETKGKDIYGEEGVEVITNKVYKNKTVYRKSFYNKRNMSFLLEGLKKENIFYYTFNGRCIQDDMITYFGDSFYIINSINYVMIKIALSSQEDFVAITLIADSKDETFFNNTIIEYDAYIEYIKDEE